MNDTVLRGLKEALVQDIESHHLKILDAVEKYESRLREELHRPSAAVVEPKTKKMRGAGASAANERRNEVEAAPPPPPPQSAPAPQMDRNKELKRLTNKNVKEGYLKGCFTCATASVDCKFRKSKVKDNVSFNVLKKGFMDTADEVKNMGIITMDLHPFWLCGNHRGSKNVEIDMSKLAPHYFEFCEVFDIALDERVYERLKEADKKKRLKVSASSDDNDEEEEEDEYVEDMQIDEVKHEQQQEEEEQEIEEELQLEEDVEPDRADAEDMLKVFQLLQPQNLRSKNIDDYKLIYTTACPVPELQIVLFDEKLKICVATELQPDTTMVPELYIGFYSSKYTDAVDASPTHEKTRWVPCMVSLFVEAGESDQKAKKGVEHFLRLANQMLDRKHRNN
jgi:hypothetical protein